MRKAIAIILGGVLTCCAPADRNSRLETALKIAGENRTELEKVLEHYSGDSLKLKAATFLIENMPGHISYRDRDGEARFYAVADSVLRSIREIDFDSQRAALDSLMARPEVDFRKAGTVQDAEIITAGFLIDNIDRAFEAWQGAQWNRHLTFDEFCEALLPYKSAELQPLGDWREKLAPRFSRGIDEWEHCDVYNDSPVMFCVAVNKCMRDSLRPAVRVPNHPVRILNYPQQLQIPFGACADYADIATSVMRSKGIPVVKDYVPVWGYRAPGHGWNAVFDADGTWVPFGGVLTDPGEEGMVCERKSKVYRTTYARNPRISRMHAAGGYVPRAFQLPFMSDVTRQYIRCADLEISLPDEKDGYVWLALSDRTGWDPIDFCLLENGKGRFTDVGFNCMYTVLRYGPNGERTVLTPPFVFNRDGRKQFVIADENHRRTVKLQRKYITLPHVASFNHRLKGGEFQAADNPEFRNCITVHTVADHAPVAHRTQVADSVGAWRYWRYRQKARWTHCNIAEIKFFDRDSTELRGEIIGTEGSYGDRPGTTRREVFDSDPLTSFDAPVDSGGWVGMDFGRPLEVAHIWYIGRGDGNAVEEGDQYELCYFKDGRWVSLGRKTADSPEITFDDVPDKALLILRDLTKGVEERIFTYENGRQRWW